MTRPSSRAGFTLLELLVALTAGALVVSTIYYVGGASQRHFHEQQRIAQTQMSVRMAMDQLRRDVQLAGFHGSPNTMRDRRCAVPDQELQAVAVEDDVGTIDNAAENGAQADRLRLVGNFATGDAYLTFGIDATGNRLLLQQTWQGFRRSFLAQDGTTIDSGRFDSVFRTGRILAIRGKDGGNLFLTTIIDRNAADGSITVSPSIGSTCESISQALVAPLSQIEYAVERFDDSGRGDNLQSVSAATAALTGDVGSQLVRRELDFGGDPINGTERVVLEFVADFNVDAIVDNETTPGAVPDMAQVADDGVEALLGPGNVAANPGPHSVRSLLVRLAARTAEQDPRFPWIARAAGEPMTRFRANPDLPGAARVRTLEAELLVPNVAFRSLR